MTSPTLKPAIIETKYPTLKVLHRITASALGQEKSARKYRHHSQHESVGYGRLKHVDDASGEIVGQDERRDSPFSRSDDQPGSIR